jgi:tetratricopeptide (TPR) repeat protein/transcriptional regulator with XRE-family HTH domain
LNDDHVLEAGGFGVLLRRYRLASGLSQEELAQRAGLSVRALANMERGRTKRPYKRSVRLLAEAMALPEPQRLHLDRASRLVAADPPRPSPAMTGEPVPAAAPPAVAPGQPPVADLAQPPADQAAPRELPAPVSQFTGRAAELDELSDMAAQADGRALVICAVGGTAGVGKTALAVHWAHQVADRFPDGQLYVNLRGYDPDRPLATADALAGLLRTLGVPGANVPDGAQDRARLYRSTLAGRRMLVLLDNARNSDQVRPLLPGDPACVAVVTSRDALAGLVARDGARRLDLDVLPGPDAVALLRSLIGPRADDDPAAAAELARLCARLPLALRIAAELAVSRRGARLRDLMAELAENRLDLLDAGEERADVRAVFSWSYWQLPDDVAGAFALIGLTPGADLDVYATAALTGTTARQARRILDRLHRASLVQACGPGRYGIHDLLRAYAREHAAARDTDGWCQQALTRLFGYYLAAAAAAMDILFPAEAHLRPGAPPANAEIPAMPGEADARAWLDRERANLVAAAMHCADHGWPRHAAGLGATLHRYLINGSHLPEAHAIYSGALHAARRSADPAAEASALHGLGSIRMKKGHFRDAADHYRAALERYRQHGERAGQARVLHNLGVTEFQLHNHHAAADYYRQAVAAYQEAGDSLGAAGALCGLANAETELGAYDQAAEHLQLALPVIRRAQDRYREARALEGIGELNLRQGQLTQAAGFFGQALTLYRHVDQPAGVANGLFSLGQVSVRQREYSQAIGYLRQALAVFRQASDQYGEMLTLRTLAEALHGDGQPAAARGELAIALGLAAETGNTYQQARAHHDLAESHHDAGQEAEAQYHWQRALTLYTQLGAPEADQVQSRLSPRAAAGGRVGQQGSGAPPVSRVRGGSGRSRR